MYGIIILFRKFSSKIPIKIYVSFWLGNKFFSSNILDEVQATEGENAVDYENDGSEEYVDKSN